MSVLPTTDARPGSRTNGQAHSENGAGGTDREFEGLVRRMLELIGEDPAREGLRDTPARVRKSLQWLTRGYRSSAREAVGSALFQEAHRSMVLVRGIDVHSLCEHHMLPFFGHAHVAYIPDGRIVGLSKLARVIEVFARRLQVQERLTEEVAGALEDLLRPRAVGVIIEARHHCMMMRGVEKQGSSTITTAVRGTFALDNAARREFLGLAMAGRSS